MVCNIFFHQVAAKRCGKVFSKSSKQEKSKKGKRGGSSRPGKKAEPNAEMEREDEQLSEKKKIEIMVQWALNGFEPSGPEGFAPSEGKSELLMTVFTLSDMT